ncbi:FxsC protein [Streptomyces avidinii]
MPTRPEILIVDRWAVEDEDRRQRLAAFDRDPRPWINVVVPWNRYDHQFRDEGERAGRPAGGHHAEDDEQGRAACRAAANGVADVETLGQILPQVVEAAAQQFLRHAQPYPPKGDTSIERPRLLGPMGMNGPPGPSSPRVPFPPDSDRHRTGPAGGRPPRQRRQRHRPGGRG